MHSDDVAACSPSEVWFSLGYVHVLRTGFVEFEGAHAADVRLRILRYAACVIYNEASGSMRVQFE